MKTNLRTFTSCVKIHGYEERGSYFQTFVGLYWTGLETKRQIAKKMRPKRKKEKRKKRIVKKVEGIKKPKIQASLNSQLIRKVNKVKKQNKTKKTSKKKNMLNNESPLIKTCTTSLF